jgi:hypothetical protein
VGVFKLESAISAEEELLEESLRQLNMQLTEAQRLAKLGSWDGI